jgi:hypothetical protein
MSSILIAMLASGPAAIAPNASDEVVCKRFLVPGSLVKKRRVCYTRAQWKKMIEQEQDAVYKFIEGNRGTRN